MNKISNLLRSELKSRLKGQLLRGAAVAALLFASPATQAQDFYVIKAGNNFLAHNTALNGGLTNATLFSATTCLWTIDGNQIVAISPDGTTGYQLNHGGNYNGYTLSMAASGDSWSNASAGSNPYINLSSNRWGTQTANYYIRYNNGWTLSTTNTDRGTVTKLTFSDAPYTSGSSSTSYSASVNGDGIIYSTSGTHTYTADVNQIITYAQTSRTFSGYANSGTTDATITKPYPVSSAYSGAVTNVSWSVSPTTYGTINASTGVLTITSLPATSANITITYTAQAGGQSITGTMQVMLVKDQSTYESLVITLDDREDHTWTYYSGVDASVDGGNYNTNYAGKLYSPNPRNVKITYNGVNGITGSSTAVKVSVNSGETHNTFIYYKTLEEGTNSGEYPYQVISNPFSVRPSTGSGNSKVYYGFAGWKIVSGGEYIKNHSNGDVLALDEEIVFNNLPYPSVNCTSAEIVFQTTWTQANVRNGNNISTMLGNFNGGTYETNFAVMTGSYTTAWTGNKNVTVTSVYPDGSSDTRSNNNYTRLNVTVNSGYTVKYEYININDNSSTLSMGTGTKTLYIGRGVSNTSANGVVCATIQGYDGTINSGGLTYTLKIESGIYNYLSYIKGYDGAGTTNTVTGTVSVKGILGCDYDRAKNDNSKLKIQTAIIMGYATNTNYKLLQSASAGQEVLNVTFKSGSLHSSRSNAGTADAGESFYIGVGGGYSPGYRVFTMEGGEMWSLAAGICQNTATTNSIRFRIKGGLIKGSIYGSAANADSYGYKTMVLTGGTVRGWIAGGGNGTSANGGTTTGSSYLYVGGNCRVDSEGSNTKINSSVGGQVFGSGSGVENTTTWGEMLYGSNVVIADNAYVERNVFGGGNFGWTDQYANIYLTGEGMSVGKVFGGANQNKGDNVRIYMTGGTVREGLYGGSNTTGTINYNVEMHINGGQVGTSSSPANIHGGGYGQPTRVSQNVDITLGATGQTTPGVTVYGDVYGGSALGYVNGTTATTTYHTNVTLNKGTIHGSLYGGALGDANTAANVYGPVAVKVYGGSVKKTDANGANGSGGVYGANNVNGAPQRAVTVDIYGTDPAPSANEYALFAVYGGGNAADYTYGNGYPKVTVHNCNNSIEYVYGGGNAAAVAATDVTIYGGNVIGNVFGGGNGTVTAANVTGNTLTKIYGGTILRVFGGSNSQGTIGGTITVNANSQKEGDDYCPMHVGELYGGGNMANSNVGSVNIGCMNNGDLIDYVYGGANQADITGNIALTMTGGRVENLFGGNNTSGAVKGKIQVTVNWDGSCNKNYLGNVFGGGNLAQYSIYGYNNDGTVKTSGTAVYDNPVVQVLNGTVSGNVYGGGKGDPTATGNQKGVPGSVTGNPVVTIGDNTSGHESYVAAVTGDVYGGGDAANVGGTPVVNIINKCNTTISGDVYGGGNAADVTGTDVNIDGGTISGMVFGGGHGDKNSNPQKQADVNGNVAVDITGGTINKVFGGSNSKGNITGTVAVNIAKGNNSCDMHITEVYGGGNEAAGNAGTLTIGCTGDYTTKSEGITNVYGGANAAAINNNINLTIRGGHIDNVYGGNNTSGTISGTIAVNVNWNDALTCDKYLGNVFGGGNLAAYTGSPTVTLTNGTVSHNIYGGGNEAGVGGSTVNINGGSVAEGVFGGCNTSGTVTGAIAVNLTSGIIGAQNGTTDIVFGGGYGDQTATQGNVTVTVNGSTIHGNVYGGSALGQVNNESTDLTTVHVLAGTVNGNIYGGGLGQAGDGNVTKGQVNGTVTVNIGATDGAQNPTYSGNATINGSVYGCNNTNGSPKANVTVNVYQTAHTEKNAASYTQNDATYAIDQVFGGGNQADYNPTATTSRATVHVYTCNNTIRRVFGGGNAAAAYGVVTTIDGGRFDYIFGGGNGEGGHAANIGAGGTNLTVNSGVINYLFGGSNETGTINGTMGVTINNTGCTEQIKNFFAGGNLAVIGSQQNPVNLSTTITCGTVFDAVYGGSNLADIYGNVTLTINGGTIGEVFAGSKGRSATSDPNNSTPKAADIYGNTTLNIHAGAIGNAFGGSNINGNITGTITVNLDWNQSDCAQKSINNIFGASNLAAYTPTTPGAYPAVNIKHGTVSQNVFGGGKGDAADHTKGQVTSNPVVTIGDITSGHELYEAIVMHDIYGGGDAGNVLGTPVVNIPNKSNTSIGGDIYGGGNAADVNGTDVNIYGGDIDGMVFGGGHGDKDATPQKQADVNGNVAVTVYGGTISKVFGGANSKGDITGTVAVRIDKSTANGAADMKIGEVYGGGNFAAGNAGSITIGCTGTWTTTGEHNHTNANTTDNRIGYELEGIGTVFGGANMADIGTAQNPSNIEVNINSGMVVNVFGGNNNDGDIHGTITVNIAKNNNACSWYVGNVYGGGFNADYTNAAANNPAVNVSAGRVSQNVYGGGKGSGAVVTGNPTVTLSGSAEVGGNVYGGGDAAAVEGNTNVIIN